MNDNIIFPIINKIDTAAKNIDNCNVWSGQKNAYNSFCKQGFPNNKLEKWRNTDILKNLSIDYEFIFDSLPCTNTNIKDVFKCEIQNFETHLITFLNGSFVCEKTSITELANGVIIGSLKQVWESENQILKKFINTSIENELNGLIALNSAFATNGAFIYVPDNVNVEKPIQIVNIIDSQKNIFVQSKNIVVLGKNSSLQIVQCDDSINDKNSFSNIVNEFFIGEGAKLDHYKMQNKDNTSTLVNTSFFNLEKDSNLSTNTITLNGGNIRNESIVNLNGEGGNADILGLYLADKKQHIDNQIVVRHNVPNCTSNELFKGILDDEASAVFNGHIIVKTNAQKTSAYQNNKNILLTDDAKIFTQPFLEIYADDVKCSHGASIGQIDENALFYLMQRGICEINARMLLMYAFAQEITDHIKIADLHDSATEMVSLRLKGELSPCDQCMLHCGNNNTLEFKIDESKL